MLNALTLLSETALLLWRHAVNPSLGAQRKVPFSDGCHRKSAVCCYAPRIPLIVQFVRIKFTKGSKGLL